MPLDINAQDIKDIGKMTRIAWYVVVTAGRYIKNGTIQDADVDVQAKQVSDRVQDILNNKV